MGRSGDGAGALEEGWLLAELRDRFWMTVEELGKRFDRSASWVNIAAWWPFYPNACSGA